MRRYVNLSAVGIIAASLALPGACGNRSDRRESASEEPSVEATVEVAKEEIATEGETPAVPAPAEEQD